MPKFIHISLKFNKSNALYIIDAVAKEPILVAQGSIDKISRYKEKGEINLTEEQIVSIVSDKQTDI
jgi:hypothetical protein